DRSSDLHGLGKRLSILSSMFRLALGLVAALFLAACAGEPVWAPDDAVAAARYSSSGQPEISLLTSLSDRSSEGAHTALLINGSQRILFDPAGNWDHSRAPERNDVRFGMSPDVVAHYLGFQASTNYHAVLINVPVSAEVAERAIALAMQNGAVGPALCASATSAILRQLPGFESISSSAFPKTLMKSFAQLPGARAEVYYGAPGEHGRPTVDSGLLPPSGATYVGGSPSGS
ncbi:MAG: hypothetical protein Q7J57_16000, partial [Gemmobacter sp.]|nr:hypothetical protein [Gemmobacter sp.]